MKTTHLLILLCCNLFAAEYPIEKRVNDLEATIVGQAAELYGLNQIDKIQQIEFERIRQAQRDKLQAAELKKTTPFKNKK